MAVYMSLGLLGLSDIRLWCLLALHMYILIITLWFVIFNPLSGCRKPDSNMGSRRMYYYSS
jgi:hypothetical protein